MRKLFTMALALTTAATSLVLVAAPAQAMPGTTVAPASTVSARTANLAGTQTRDLYNRLMALLPTDHKARIAALEKRLGLTDHGARDMVDSVINPDEHTCKKTKLFEWLDNSIAGWTEDEILGAFVIMIFDPVTYDALLFPEDPARRTYGAKGEYTSSLERSFRGLKGFWDIKSSDIEMVPAHGSTLLDRTRVARAVKASMGLSDADAAEAAEMIATLADQDVYDHGNAPIFTFNAFAFSAEGEEIPGLGNVGDKIVMGDGILEGFRAIGLGDVAPGAILSHEFGHHIQFERNLFESELTGPEATRRTELMADSFSAYFLAHNRGANLRWARVKQFLGAFYNIGDCAFDSPGHHGTPNQRLRAAGWGTGVAVTSWPPSRVLPSKTFAARFERVLPFLVAPDAPSADALAAGRV